MHNSALNDQCQQELSVKLGCQEDQAAKQVTYH